jgi:hypothetical protein
MFKTEHVLTCDTCGRETRCASACPQGWIVAHVSHHTTDKASEMLLKGDYCSAVCAAPAFERFAQNIRTLADGG